MPAAWHAATAAVAAARLSQPYEPQVSRYLVTRFEPHQISGDEFLRGHRPLVAVADHPGMGTRHRPQALQRGLGLGLLDETGDGVDQHHTEDHDRVDVLAQHRRASARRQQHVDQRVVELAQDSRHRSGALGGGQAVGPEPRQPLAGFRAGQPAQASVSSISTASWTVSPWCAAPGGVNSAVTTSPRRVRRDGFAPPRPRRSEARPPPQRGVPWSYPYHRRRRPRRARGGRTSGRDQRQGRATRRRHTAVPRRRAACTDPLQQWAGGRSSDLWSTVQPRLQSGSGPETGRDGSEGPWLNGRRCERWPGTTAPWWPVP